MRRIIGCAAMVGFLALGLPASAQIVNTSDAPINWKAETDLLRMDVRAQKRDLVAKNMGLTPAEDKLFWPIYEEYEAELQLLWNERITLIAEYGSHYPNVTDEQASSLMERSLELDDAIIKLRKTYYRKFKKALSAKTAARFVQIDRRLNSLLELQVLNSIPLVK